ncbi:replicative DNA helicase [Brevibacillus agri]|nr:replicative DNA helicase [Brevibacillus agri]MDR9504734.1 replicative DNA helicase [Brevibacillus agri]
MGAMFDRLPPKNIEAEQSVLGAIFLSKQAMETASEKLTAEDFYPANHQRIFSVMLELYDADKPIDLVTVTAELQDKKLLEEVGGIAYLTNLASSVPTAANVGYYADIVAEKAYRRRVIEANTKAINQAYESETVEELIAEQERIAMDLGEKRKSSSDFVPIKDAMMDAYEEIDRLSTRKTEITGVPSGYPDLDAMTGGFQRSDLIILAARPSVGKTAFALNIAQNIGIKTGETVAIFSLEMSTLQLVKRMICAEGNIDASKMRNGGFEGDDWERMTRAIGNLAKAKIFIDDSPGLTVQEIRRKARKLKQQHGLGMILIDYLQLVHCVSKGNRQEQVSEVSRMLKAIARELDVPVIALSQLSRSVEQRQDKRPMMSDIRESGSIEQDADIVAFLYRDDYYDKESANKNVVEVIIAKQRNGPTGTVELAFLKEHNKFVSIDHRYDRPTPADKPADDDEKDRTWR